MLPLNRRMIVKKINKAATENPLSGNKNLYRLDLGIFNRY